jgi:hypothetical protein
MFSRVAVIALTLASFVVAGTEHEQAAADIIDLLKNKPKPELAKQMEYKSEVYNGVCGRRAASFRYSCKKELPRSSFEDLKNILAALKAKDPNGEILVFTKTQVWHKESAGVMGAIKDVMSTPTQYQVLVPGAIEGARKYKFMYGPGCTWEPFVDAAVDQLSKGKKPDAPVVEPSTSGDTLATPPSPKITSTMGKWFTSNKGDSKPAVDLKQGVTFEQFQRTPFIKTQLATMEKAKSISYMKECASITYTVKAGKESVPKLLPVDKIPKDAKIQLAQYHMKGFGGDKKKKNRN